MNKSLFSALKVERNVMFIILTLIIIVAAFNIISGLTILVKNKTREIAILKSIGVKNNSIRKIFFLVGFIIGCSATIFGVILGIIFSPLAWTMGIPWEEASLVGRLMGEKIILTELIAYGSLGELVNSNLISERSAIIASYALCGFANFGSIGIQLGGIGSMAPEKRNILSKIVFKAMIGGALASWLTATIAGILI